MPKEPHVQAELTRRYRAPSAGGPSVWTVVGILLVAVSLVLVGAVVTLNSVTGSGPNSVRFTGPTPTAGPAPSTPIVRIVGPAAQGQDGSATPTTTGTGTTPGLAPPASASGPIVAPAAPPLFQQPGTSSPGASPPAGGEPAQSAAGAATPADPATAPSPDPVPTAEGAPSPVTGGSPTTAQSAAERAAADAYARLTTDEEKVGQLLLLAWIGTTAEEARPALRDLRAGGIVHVQNASTFAAAATINQGLKQQAADAGLVPPLIAIDHEGGNVQRIRDLRNLGSNWEFARNRPTDLEACQRGARHAEALANLGFTMNLAPVLDVNNNPANPVIGPRSYSDDPEVVARLGAAYIRGLQLGGVAAVGKHFPGHGNTSVDSHFGLPSLPQTMADLDRIELVPFRRAIEADVAGIMSAHIVFPAVDPSGDPATLSRNVMTGLLRERLGFKGLTLSDDMGAMRAITDNFPPGEAAVRAVKAGVDMVILSSELSRQRQSRDALLAAVRDGSISRARLDQAVMNVLIVKARYGLLGEAAAQPRGICQ